MIVYNYVKKDCLFLFYSLYNYADHLFVCFQGKE